MGECGCRRVDTRVCGMRENKCVLTLGNLNRARAHLTPKARFVWLVWSLRGSFSRPWLGWKRWGSVWLGRRTHVVWALTAPERGTYVLIRSAWLHIYFVRGPCVTTSQTTQNNKPQSSQNDALHCAERKRFSAVFTCYRKLPISPLMKYTDYELVAFFSVKNNSGQWFVNVDA